MWGEMVSWLQSFGWLSPAPAMTAPAAMGRYCDTCIRLMSSSGLRQAQKPEGFAFGTLEEFRQRSLGECQFCTFLRKHVDCDYKRPLRLVFTAGLDEHGKRYYLDSEVGKWRIKPFDSLKLYEISEWKTRYHITSVFAVASPGNPAASFITRRPPERDFSSDRAFFVAKSWIRECLSTSGAEHRDCPRPEMPDLPKRIVDVGQDLSGDFIRVHEPLRGEKAQYACLSYCWGGGSQAIITTKATLETLKQGVALNAFGKTIQDAVEITRGLGLRYLWIDALCIVQDDDEDRSGEIQKMGSIYSHCFVTIAAAMAKGASEGFLHQLDQEPILDFEHYPFSIVLPDGTEGIIRLYPKNVGKISASEERERTPLDDRGWAFQETLLSPRVLLFAKHELLWLCHNKGYRQAQRRYITYTSSIKEAFLRYNSTKRTSDLSVIIETRWKNIVEEYTRRKLSDPEDRLNAIAGIATALAENSATFRGLEYCFGLWNHVDSDLLMVRQLGWRCNETTLKTSTKSPRAPTWSWASVDDPVLFPIDLIGKSEGLPRFHLKATTLEPYVEDADAYALRLKAHILPLAQLGTRATETLKIWMDTTEGPPTDPTGYYCMLWAVESYKGDGEKVILLLRETTRVHLVDAFERVAFATHRGNEFDKVDSSPFYKWPENNITLV